MALDFDNHNQEDESVFPVKLDENAELDKYGVWIKQKPAEESNDDLKTLEQETEESFEIEDYNNQNKIAADNTKNVIEFDDLDEISDLNNEHNLHSTPSNEDYEKQKENIILSQESKEETEADMDVNDFETLDLDDFLSEDLSETTPTPASTKKVEKETKFEKIEPENLEINIEEANTNSSEFDNELEEFTVFASEEKTTEDNANAKNIEETNEFDDLLDDLGVERGSAETSSITKEKVRSDGGAINMNITIDEDSDITTLSGKSSDSEENLDDIAIFEGNKKTETAEIKEKTEVKKEKPKEDSIIIESTIIEADNMEAIKAENEKILNQSSKTPANTADEENLDSLDSMLDDLIGVETEPAPTIPSESDAINVDGIIEDTEPIEETRPIQKTIEDKPMIEDTAEDFSMKDFEIQDNSGEKNPIDNILNTTEKANIKPEEMYFDDVEALKNDMLDEEKPALEETDQIQACLTPQRNPLQNDKATEILMQIAGELSSIKQELANLKTEVSTKVDIAHIQNTKTNNLQEEIADNNANEPEIKSYDDSGFFGDDDSDETIALTGDELNNILITADFTEEQANENFDAPDSIEEDSIENIEDNNEEINEIDMESESFEDDEFEIPEILDESATSEEPEDRLDTEIEPENINTVTEDISYLDENGAMDIENESEEYIEIPDFNNEQLEEPNLDNFDMTIKELELPNGQSVQLGESGDNSQTEETSTDNFDNLEDEEDPFDPEDLDSTAEDIPHLELNTNTAEQHKLDIPSRQIPEGEHKMPIHLKEEIKSVLTYMDQLLESLPENKIEEFAKSEYFDTYKRLFEELGIS